MAENIKVGIQVSSNGTADTEIKKAHSLKAAYEGAGKAASNLGGTAGSRAVAAQAMPKGSQAMADESTAYGQARAAVGTGAAGRDFAQQAQGLGGLVHVYATFAANLFAVSAAFRALSDAADTTNMVKGMDQLGAVSGQALGSLAKQLANVTGGAISMREAMDAATKGSSAGLSSDQLLKMAEVAKKSSQALGINMVDAMSRLSRGISKLEPELLDELGIYTKLQKSTDDYARSIGKTASSLTDFERRQAFANAVLKEGLDKFGNIKLEANPYDTILASIKNIGQTGLEVINKVLTPIVSLLATSPAGLATVLAGIGALLLKQAIPAIGMFRENAARMQDEAHSRVEKMVRDQQEAASQMDQIAATRAEKAFQLEKTTQDKIAKLSSARFNKAILGDEMRDTLKKSAFDLTNKDVAALKNKADTLLASDDEIYRKQGDKLAKHLDKVNSIRAQSENVYLQAAEVREKRDDKWYSHQQQLAKNLATLQESYAKRKIISDVSDTAALLGPSAAFSQLKDEVSKLDASGFSKKMTTIKGTLTIATSAIGTAINAFGVWGQAIGLVIAGFGILDSWLSKNSEEMTKYSDAMVRVRDSGKLVVEVLKNIEQAGKGFLTVENILARASAFKELSDSVMGGITALESVDMKANWWDRFIDGWKSVLGKDLQSTFTTDMAAAISNGINAIPEGELRDSLVEKLKGTLGTADLTFEGISAAGKAMSKAEIIPKFKKAGEAIAEVSNKASEASKNLKTLKDDFGLLETSYQNLITSLALSDPLSKFGSQLLKVGVDMGKAFQDPINAFAELKDLLKDPAKLSLLPEGSVEKILALSDAVKASDDAINQYSKDIKTAREELKALQAERAPSEGEDTTYTTRLQAAEQKQTAAIQGLRTATDDLRKFSKEGASLQLAAMKEGINLLTRSVENAKKSAAVTVGQTLFSGVEGGAAAQERGRLAQVELSIQESNIKATVSLTDAILQNRLALESNTAVMEKQDLEAKAAKGELSPSEAVKLENLNKLIPDLDKIKSLFATKTIGTADITTLSPGAASFVTQRKEQQLGVEAQLAGIAGKRKSGQISTELDVQQQTLAFNQKILAANTAIQNIDKQRLEYAESFLPYLSEAQLAAKTSAEDAIAELNITTKRNEILGKEDDLKIRISNSSGKQKTILLEQLAAQQELDGKLLSILEKEEALRKVKQDVLRIDNAFTKNAIERENKTADFNLTAKSEEQAISAAQELLSIKSSMSLITDADAEKQRNELDRQSTLLGFAKQQNQVQDERAAKLAEIQLKIDKAALDPKADIGALNEQYARTESRYTRELELLDRTKAAKLEALSLNQSMSEKMKGFSNIVKSSFESMGDALVNFAKTGKLNFKDLVNDMITELVRFELRAQMSALYQSMGGLSGIVKLFTGPGTFGTPGGAGSSVIDSTATMAGGSTAFAAKGAYFDSLNSNFHAFAQGGTFTNSIVSSPTLFKFAQGTGLMGEAGPEAIMPLKRDSNGTLGVRANQQQANVDVVVNNYTSEKASTKESTDSKGNRRIEVIIGEMVAQEIGRSNSPMNSGIKANFQVQPNLVRR